MIVYPVGANLHDIGMKHKRSAALLSYDGSDRQAWRLERLRFALLEYSAECILSLDVGAHTCGWWKNPDYDTCLHLSLSFFDLETREPAPQDHKAANAIVRGIFGAAHRLAWCEPPSFPEGKQRDVWHYRVFVDRSTMLPILPRGEVYSKELTEAGWKSFSDVQAAAAAAKAATP